MNTTQKQNLAHLLLSDGLNTLEEFYEERVEAIGWTVGVEVPEYGPASEQLNKWSEHLFGMDAKAQARIRTQLDADSTAEPESPFMVVGGFTFNSKDA